jgi:ligand-binding sensor domain-containing protein/signal transduction histidine kinase
MRFAICLLFSVQTLMAQPYYFRHYQVENGLSNNTVFCSMQDKDGFMWFGTKDGLNRFDGYRFKLLNLESNNEQPLSRDQITSLLTDDKEILWVGSQKGLFQFDARKERLVRFLDSFQNIRELSMDKKGQLWFISGFTVIRYSRSTNKVKVFSPSRYFSATSICQSEEGTLWVATVDGFLLKFDTATEAFQRYNVFSHSPAVVSNWIEKIRPTGSGSIYIGTSSQGLKEFDIATSTYKDVLMYNPDKTAIYVRDILQRSEQEFWFATESGIFILNTETKKIITLKKNYLDPYSLSDNAIYTLYKDTEGGVWAGTYFGGLNYFPRQYSPFHKYFPDYTKNSISGNVVREITEDHFGNLWLATEDAGLNKLDRKTGLFTHFEPTGAPTSIAYSNIHGLIVVGNDLWVGTFEHGLDILDVKTGKVKQHYSAGNGPNDLKNNFIITFLQTRNAELFVGTGGGLYKYDAGTRGFLRQPEIPDNVFVSCLVEDHEGTIWMGTYDRGLYYLNPATHQTGHFLNDPVSKYSLPANSINALYADSHDNLWLATDGGGLCQLSKDRKQFSRLTTANGLPSNIIFKVLEDNRKHLWATTTKGLINLDSNNKITVYTKANGLLNDQFNYNSGYKDSEGRLYFGSVKGMITFKPDSFYHSSLIPPIYITGFQIHNKELDVNKDSSFLNKSIIYTDRITLPHDQSSFSIDFSAVAFNSPEMTGYSYFMKGLDKDWTYLKSNRKVYFTNLAPGKYTFKLKAVTGGIWSKEEKRLSITILPPYWATTWAYLIYIILGIALLSYLVRNYHKRIEIKKEKEIYEAKIDFFTNVAHEIRTPLTLIKGPLDNLNEIIDEVPQIKEDVVTMERNTSRLIRLISQILDFRQIETKGFSLDFTRVNINEIIKEAYFPFQAIVKKRGLICIMDLPHHDIYMLADVEALHKIFSNLFSNVVKYSDKKVKITLLSPDKEDADLIIAIENDGIIIPEEKKEKIFEPFYRLKETTRQKGTGIGLALARSLAELHKGKLYLKCSHQGWNTFILSLPLEPVAENKKTKQMLIKPR